MATSTSRLIDRSTSSTTPEPGPANPEPIESGTPRAWALAASAVLWHFNGLEDDLLGGAPATPAYVRDLERSLSEWWGIGNRDDLLGMLWWLDQGGGHRVVWEELDFYLASLDEDELALVLAQTEDDPQMRSQVETVQKYAPTLGAKSLLGWDYTRYICLCRWGYACGFISEEEAWDLIMPIAALLQETFSSWEELGENYLIGREFWSYEETKRKGGTIREVYETLLTSPSSPWQKNRWGMDLGVLPSDSFS